jgi:hypothetical protein
MVPPIALSDDWRMGKPPEQDDVGLARLERILSATNPKRTLSLPQLHGFLFAVACAPVDVRFGQIVQRTFYDVDDPHEWRRATSDEVLRPLFALYEETCRQVDTLEVELPAVCALRPRPLENLEPGAPIADWVVGFGYGHTWFPRSWDDRLTHDQERMIGDVMGVFLFFASKTEAERVRASTGGTRRPTLAALARTNMRRFRYSMVRYAVLGAVARGVGVGSVGAEVPFN